jgi:hypothetical protein
MNKWKGSFTMWNTLHHEVLTIDDELEPGFITELDKNKDQN